MNERIDVHHHILPPEYVATVGEKRIGPPAPNHEVPKWDVPKSIEAMDRNGITSAVVSVSAPGVLLDDPGKTSRLARACNQFAAQMVADHPTRYGMFASLPLPDTRASLLELNYALDVLHAEGIVLMTNYCDRYLCDPDCASDNRSECSPSMTSWAEKHYSSKSNVHQSTAPVTRAYLMKAIAVRPPITNEKPVGAMKRRTPVQFPVFSFMFRAKL
jgi:hypothetical protein